MADLATPNLPARDLDASAAFYARLGFEQAYRDPGWMILRRGDLVLELYPDPDVDPASTAGSCCLRLDDAAGFLEGCRTAGVPEGGQGWPRVHALRREGSGLDIGALVDLDGSLLRVVQNPAGGA